MTDPAIRRVDRHDMDRHDMNRDELDWDAFKARLLRFVRRYVGPSDAEEVTGEVLLRLVRHRDALSNARDPLAYMHGVARNAITDLHRRRAAERRTMEGAAILDAGGGADSGPAADSEFPPAQTLAPCLIPLIRGLPIRYAEALMLTDIEGLTREAAARRLGLSYSGLRSRVQRGRALLKHALLRCCQVETNRRGDILDYRPVETRRCGCAL
ncbi:MAG: sigma-70 family RNA polymerase sigma factor [Alphaproteobacteria bacterium]|nr:sigma-70 family RNA polymerase sigma factor [Alphaproteobacteria bacterium]